MSFNLKNILENDDDSILNELICNIGSLYLHLSSVTQFKKNRNLGYKFLKTQWNFSTSKRFDPRPKLVDGDGLAE